MDPVVHFELPAENRRRVAEFYTKAFGWKTNQMGPDMGNYIVVNTAETDSKGMIKTLGAINGGIYEKTPEMPPQHPSVVIAVDDIKESFLRMLK